jgi:putative transposase
MKIINYNQSRFKVEGDELILSKLEEVKVLLHRPFEGGLKGVIVKKNESDWYAIFQCEAEKKPLEETSKAVGIDLGVDKLVVTSDGVVAENPKSFDKIEKNTKPPQHSLTWKKRGSKNYERPRNKLAKLHEHAKNLMNDYIHKITTRLVQEYDEIYAEYLGVRGMVEKGENKTLRKHILHSNFSLFTHHLSYKAS